MATQLKGADTESLDTLLYGDLNGHYTGDFRVLGTWEVAAYLGIERSRIARWLGDLERGKTPIAPPVARLKSTPLWTFDQVRAKAAAMYRDAGMPLGPKGLDEWLASRRRVVSA
jgi:hypothetical protein